MTVSRIKHRIKWLKNEIAMSRSTCPMDYADWIGELRGLEKRLKEASK